MNDDKISDLLVKGIISSFKKLIKDAKFDKTIQGKVIKVLSNHQYEVFIKGNTYVLKSHFTHAVNDVVMVCLPMNNVNKAFIIH